MMVAGGTMRSRKTVVVCVLAVGVAGVAGLAQGRQGGGTGAPQPIADALRASWSGAKANIAESAKVVPESLYSYSPVPKTVRTIGQIIGHVAGANYEFCSAAKGEKSPHAEAAFESLATKPSLVKAWDESVAYCDAVFASLTDRSASEPIVMPFGMGKGVRTSALLANIGHLNEHYGNLVTYMRMNGIVPPSSRR
jgi:uncharacterized damage-inducible protein DinB